MPLRHLSCVRLVPRGTEQLLYLREALMCYLHVRTLPWSDQGTFRVLVLTETEHRCV